MWIETRGRQERVYWRTGQPGKAKDYEAFATREEAQRFRQAAMLAGGPEQARRLLRELAKTSEGVVLRLTTHSQRGPQTRPIPVAA